MEPGPEPAPGSHHSPWDSHPGVPGAPRPRLSYPALVPSEQGTSAAWKWTGNVCAAWKSMESEGWAVGSGTGAGRTGCEGATRSDPLPGPWPCSPPGPVGALPLAQAGPAEPGRPQDIPSPSPQPVGSARMDFGSGTRTQRVAAFGAGDFELSSCAHCIVSLPLRSAGGCCSLCPRGHGDPGAGCCWSLLCPHRVRSVLVGTVTPARWARCLQCWS